ncbi:ABC transporter ATP-binding protein [Nocardioides panacisoli]|uniref:ABC transporter ATP-binding protein n=1 Tax=Nocardioides panacisoli TaxID=627624 RepID=UPI001C631043|nr:ABC transporter ATP-binding protein [Nocardioides panacisoli]QYJ03531.1 ABC transporter ATP-binding protein [Nocardioides panacisoli]
MDLTVAPGEFMTLLGPSGSGKTTTLNLIAGFIEPDAGTIDVGGAPIVGLPAHKRDIGVVFQQYLLFPHMKVGVNVAFPLRRRGVSKREAHRRAMDILEIVGLNDMADRYPRQLSGGQQQRVALARALVFNPKLLLLDEPLGALDKRLRESLQLEIRRIHRDLGVTFIFVTHDQEEALAMSDRIAVFSEGHIEQVGSGESLYHNPDTLFVAKFLGDSNVIEGSLRVDDGRTHIVDGDRRFLAPSATATDERMAIVVRPECVRLVSEAARTDDLNVMAGEVSEVTFFGHRRRVSIEAEGRTMLVDESGHGPAPKPGEKALVAWRPEDASLVGIGRRGR